MSFPLACLSLAAGSDCVRIEPSTLWGLDSAAWHCDGVIGAWNGIRDEALPATWYLCLIFPVLPTKLTPKYTIDNVSWEINYNLKNNLYIHQKGFNSFNKTTLQTKFSVMNK